MELEPTWPRTIRVWWAYAWRNLIALLVASLLGFVIGAMAAFVAGMVGAPLEVGQVVAVPLSGIIGLVISVVPMKLILGRQFGEFRLTLVQVNEERDIRGT